MKTNALSVVPEMGYGVLPAARPVPCPSPASAGAQGLSIRHTVEAHETDPAHRFHGGRGGRDTRIRVAAGGAMQRMRGRHFGSSVR